MSASGREIGRSLPSIRRLLVRFAPELRRQRGLAGGAFVAVLVEVAFRLLEPWPLGLLVDYLLGSEPTAGGGPAALIGHLDGATLLWLAPALLVLVVAGRAVAAYVSAVGFALAGNRVVNGIRMALYANLQALSIAFHKRARSGDLVLRVLGDVGMIRDVAVTALLPMAANMLILTGMVAVMAWMNWKLALVAASVTPLFWLSSIHLSRRIHVASKRQRRREGKLATGAAEMLGAIGVVQALSLEDRMAAGFSQNSEGSVKEGVQTKRLSARLERSVDVIAGLATALVLMVGARFVLNGSLSPGELVVFVSYLKSGFRPVRNFAKYTARLAKASAAAERVLDVLEREPDVQERPDAVPAPSFEGALRFEQASFNHHGQGTVLNDIDFSSAPGERVAIVGESGSGKSTLVAALLRLHDPAWGQVLIDGADIRTFTLASLRGQISVLLQESVLFSASIRDNIRLGREDATDEEVEAAARLAGAHEFIERLPDGYDTPVGERGERLSAGQRQRVAIARTALADARILIFDEPLAGLDEENGRIVRRALDRIGHGRTTILVTHDIEHASQCDRILVLANGRIAESGSHADLVCRGGPYAAMVHKARSPFARPRGFDEDAIAG